MTLLSGSLKYRIALAVAFLALVAHGAAHVQRVVGRRTDPPGAAREGGTHPRCELERDGRRARGRAEPPRSRHAHLRKSGTSRSSSSSNTTDRRRVVAASNTRAAAA